MAIDTRSRYFAEPEEAFMFGEDAMSPSFSALPQYEAPNNNFTVMPPAAAPYATRRYMPSAQPIMQQPAAAPYDMGGLGGFDFSGFYGGYDTGQYTPPAQSMPTAQPMTQQAAAPYVEPYQPLPTAQPVTTAAVPAAAPYAAPYQPLPTAQPMTQEAAAPYDLSGLAGLDLSGLNFGSNFGGGAMGGQYQPDPNLQYIAAPLSNKGNPTSQTGGNTFAVKADQPVRLVDLRTNQVVFEGSGFDAARKATELGQGLTDQFGRKANYAIQTADPTGNYSTVAYEKKNKSTLGQIANVAGTALPLAMIPLTMGLSAPLATLGTVGKIGLAAGLGGAGAALKGGNILKGAAMGGLSAAGGAYLGNALQAGGAFGTQLAPRLATAVGTGLGSTAGGLATGQSLKNSLLGGVASGALSYMSPDIAKGLGIGAAPNASVNAPADALATDIVVDALGFASPNMNIGGYQTPEQKFIDNPTKVTDPVTAPLSDQIVVSGSRFPASYISADVGSLQSSLPSAFTPNRLLPPQTPEPMSQEELDEIVVRAGGLLPATLALPPVSSGGALSDDIVVDALKRRLPSPDDPAPINLGPPDAMYGIKDPIVVTGRLPAVPISANLGGGGGGNGTDGKAKSDQDKDKDKDKDKEPGLEEYLRLAGLATGLIGGAAGAGGRRTGSNAAGGGGLQNVFSARLPRASGIFSSKNLAPRDMSGTDFLRYGYGPEKAFFQNVPTNAGERDRLVSEFRPSSLPLSAMYDPEALRQDALRQLAIGAPIEDALDALLLNATPQEIEFYTKTPKGQQALMQLLGGSSTYGTSNPSMYAPDNMRFAEGGAFAAKGYARGSSRDSFAVEGPGTGRSDDIPAVLSDGEYVIDAETVALLGDGSSKAGAKKLDEMRVKVRKHKGRNLAKGKFSVNAKRPEKYLSGGRT